MNAEFEIVRARARGAWTTAPLAFVCTGTGKPELSPPDEVRFDLSNTRSMMACAVVRGR